MENSMAVVARFAQLIVLHKKQHICGSNVQKTYIAVL